MGVRGINLGDGDEVVAMQLSVQGDYMLFVSEWGMGKMTRISDFAAQNRGGKGVKCYKINSRTGNVVGAKAVKEGQELMLITTEGVIIRIAVDSISRLGRITSGVKLINMQQGVLVAGIAKVRPGDKTENDTEEPELPEEKND